MTDRRVPVETTEGWRPSPSGGERTLVALAAMTLVVGGLIVAGNLLPKKDVVSLASASPQVTPQPTACCPRPTRSPTPTPAPIELVLASAPLPTFEATPTVFSGLIRARVELQILSAPELGSAPIGVLAAGELSYAWEDPGYLGAEGWFTVSVGFEASGWIATRAAGADLVDRYLSPVSPVSGWISNLAAGPDGFVGIGTQSATSGIYPPQMLISSSDGVRWQVASDQPPAGLSPAGAPAWGPVGWLLVSVGSSGSQSWFSTSADGSHWRIRGAMGTPTASLFIPSRLVASDAGYLLRTDPYLGDMRRTLLFSENGVNWHGVDPGLNTNDYLIGGTAGGFYAWADPQYQRPREAAFSIDGVTWSPVAGGPEEYDSKFAAVGEQWFAIETNQTTGVPRGWLGSVSGGELKWQRMPGAVASFANAVVTALVSTGDEAIAFGWDRTTEAPLTWTTTGSGWVRSELPAAFGGIPEVAVAGSAGVVVVGHRPSAPYEDPIVWHRAPNGSWQPERDPVIARLPEPSAADCAPMPRDALAFVLLDRTTAAFCYGDAAITLRAWSAPPCPPGECEGGGGGDQGTSDPAWLAAPNLNLLLLGPGLSASGLFAAVLPPTLATSLPALWVSTWLEVTGHFDDAAAVTCTYTPPPSDQPYYSGGPWVVEYCRQQFVVSAVRIVDGL